MKTFLALIICIMISFKILPLFSPPSFLCLSVSLSLSLSLPSSPPSLAPPSPMQSNNNSGLADGAMTKFHVTPTPTLENRSRI